MQMIDYPQIVGPTYSMASLNADCQRCVNLQLEAIESGEGANQYYLRETPGLKLLYDFSVFGERFANSKIQGMLTSSLFTNRLYVVIGNCLVVINTSNEFNAYASAGLMELYSPPNTDPSYIEMQIVENIQGIFVAPLEAQYVQLTVNSPHLTIGLFSAEHSSFLAASQFRRNTVDPVEPVGYNGANGLAFLGTRLITIFASETSRNEPSNFSFQISPVNAAPNAAWDILEEYSVDTSIDTLIAVIANGSELWCFGTYSYEIFIQVGGANLSIFQPIQSASSEIGCLDAKTIQRLDGSIFWLGRSVQGTGTVYMSNGFQATRISTNAIEELIRPFLVPTVGGSVPTYVNGPYTSFTYFLGAHKVYVLSLEGFNVDSQVHSYLTIAYSTSTGQWHELSYRNPITGVVSLHRGRFAASVNSMQLVADHTLPYIYQLREDVYTDNLAPIIRYRRAPCIQENNRRIFFKRLILNMEVGIGLNGEDAPLISVRWSNDNAKTFGNYHIASLGAIGKFFHQVLFNRQGSALRRVYEIYMDAPVPFRLISAELGISVGEH